MWNLKRTWIWLTRCHRCRGFGIQSPWAFWFATEVVNQHLPYYAYIDMAEKEKTLSWEQKKMARLYFRLANFLQPRHILLHSPASDAYGEYMRKGCRKATWGKAGETANADTLACINLNGTGGHDMLQRLIGAKDRPLAMVVEGIHANGNNRRTWQGLTSNPECITTFDLYHCGIVFFDNRRSKQNYIVNF